MRNWKQYVIDSGLNDPESFIARVSRMVGDELWAQGVRGDALMERIELECFAAIDAWNEVNGTNVQLKGVGYERLENDN